MDRGLAVLLTAVVGGMLAAQGPINSVLGKTVGTFQGAFVSFATGTLVLAVIAGLVLGGYGQIADVRTLAPQYLLGGLLGAGGIVAASIAGQLTMSVVVDQFGLLGVDKDPITVPKLLGVLLLAGGTLLVVRG